MSQSQGGNGRVGAKQVEKAERGANRKRDPLPAEPEVTHKSSEVVNATEEFEHRGAEPYLLPAAEPAGPDSSRMTGVGGGPDSRGARGRPERRPSRSLPRVAGLLLLAPRASEQASLPTRGAVPFFEVPATQ